MNHQTLPAGNRAWPQNQFAIRLPYARLKPVWLFVALSALIWISSPGLAQEPPGEADLQDLIEPELPAWWTVERVEIRSSHNEGDAVEPVWMQHFGVDLQPLETLYVAEDHGLERFRILVPVRRTSEGFRLYGSARSTLKRGDWEIEIVDAKNAGPLRELPRSMFDEPVAVAGSEEAEQMAAELSAARQYVAEVAGGLAQVAVDAVALRQAADEAAATLAAASHERLLALRQQHDQERAALAAANEQERSSLEREHRLRIEALQASLAAHETELSALIAAAKTERDEFADKSRRNLDELLYRQQKKLAEVATAGERERDALRNEHRARLEVLKERIADESAASEARAAADESVRAQLVEEHRAELSSLRASLEERRAAVSAAPETLLELSRAEAETAARRELNSGLRILAEEREREAAITTETASAELAVRKSWYEPLLRGTEADTAAGRQAALDLALNSSNRELRKMAFALAGLYDDGYLMARALNTIISFGDEDFQIFQNEIADAVFTLRDDALRSQVIDSAISTDNEELIETLPRVSQWAERVVGFSSEQGGQQTARAALGPPEVSQDAHCTMGLPSWYSTSCNAPEYIQVAFAAPVLRPEIVVHETGNSSRSAGFISSGTRATGSESRRSLHHG
ncbi:MAG: hypothetical protein OXI01_07930, partial [Albidovulum sp.]|nr:hypothetical protein [Albidovulum sp.]